jgi:RNA polymerase sigma-70 factor, ECF subfamily
VTTHVDFAERAEPYRVELLAYGYRMLGSVEDAEDLLQETLLRAWRARDRYDPGRASLRTWLYRIATNTCLTLLEQRSRRPLPTGLGHPASDDPNEPLRRGEEVPWLQPCPDNLAADPLGRASLRLALIAAMQLLPAKQRAALILCEALDWSAAEVAQVLQTTPPAVHSLLQRARARIGQARPREEEIGEPAERRHREVVDRYVAAFENADLPALQRLLTHDVVLEMPPFLNWYSGPEAYAGFIRRAFTLRGTHWRTRPLGANGQPAFAAYARDQSGVYALHTLQIFTVSGGAVSRATAFQDAGVFRIFNLPPTLPALDQQP